MVTSRLVLSTIGIAAAALVVLHGPRLTARQTGAPPAQAPQTGPPIFPLDDNAFLRWPLPASAAAYQDIDGVRMKPYVEHLVGIAKKSRADGNQFWGRITGTPYHTETQHWIGDRFRQFGLNVRYQEFTIPPAWFPTKWALSAKSGSNVVPLKSAHPVQRSAGTKGTLELEPIFVGLGSEAEFMGRDVKGKAVLIHSIPTPSALRHSAGTTGAIPRARAKGAAAVIIIMGFPGNFETQLWGTAEVGQLEPLPSFSIGQMDGDAVRSLIEAGQPVKLTLQLDYEIRQGLKAEVVWGTLPGETDENVVVLAHGDGYFQGAVDNASGVAAMLGLAEHFSKVPRQQRRRTMTFFAPIGHHVTHDESLVWMRDNMREFWQKTALILNAEHVATTQTYLFGSELRKSTAATAHRFYVARSKRLGELMINAFKLFGVALYAEPGLRPSGDLNQLKDLAPGIEVIESNAFYHSDQDEGTVPAAGLESIARAYSKIIDDVNGLTIRDLLDATESSK